MAKPDIMNTIKPPASSQASGSQSFFNKALAHLQLDDEDFGPPPKGWSESLIGTSTSDIPGSNNRRPLASLIKRELQLLPI